MYEFELGKAADILTRELFKLEAGETSATASTRGRNSWGISSRTGGFGGASSVVSAT